MYMIKYFFIKNALKRTITLGVPLIIMGCSGHLRTHPASPEEINGKYEGVKHYQQTLLEEISETTILIDKDSGIIIGSKEKNTCTPVETKKLIIGADFTKPLITEFDPGFLESYTFNATLSEGMLNSVNTTSTPDQGKTFSNLASAAKAGAEVPFTNVDISNRACNSGVIVKNRKPAM